jgi:hypothetical protein
LHKTPALAILTDCCSMASSNASYSVILSNSSMQQHP